jgi:hypothetical protein
MAYTVPDRLGGFDNNGTFNRVSNWVADRNAGIKILAESMDQECDNFAAGFNNCITRDMKGKPTTDFEFNNHSAYGLVEDFDEGDAAVNVAALIQDPTRLFYDSSTTTDEIILFNSYVGSEPVICGNDGYHFYMLIAHTISVNSVYLQISIEGYPMVFGNRVVKGGDASFIDPFILKANSLHECVLLTDMAGTKCLYILDIAGGSSTLNGRVDEIESEDETIIVDSINPTIPTLRVNPNLVVKKINNNSPIAGNINAVQTINDIDPDDDGNINITINGNDPDEDGDFPLIVQKINGRGPNTFGNIDGFLEAPEPAPDPITIRWNTLESWVALNLQNCNYSTMYTINIDYTGLGDLNFHYDLDFGNNPYRGSFRFASIISTYTGTGQVSITVKNSVGGTIVFDTFPFGYFHIDESVSSTIITAKTCVLNAKSVISYEGGLISVKGQNNTVSINGCNLTKYTLIVAPKTPLLIAAGISTISFNETAAVMPDLLGWSDMAEVLNISDGAKVMFSRNFVGSDLKRSQVHFEGGDTLTLGGLLLYPIILPGETNGKEENK